MYKAEHSTGKGVGSALLYAAPCRLYVSRLYRNEFALSFGGNSLLLLQAASGSDAQDWVVALAACLFFTSAAFEAVLAECRRFFDAAHKTVAGRLSLIEALDLVRAMGREITYSQVLDAVHRVSPESGGWFGIREFTFLVRSVCCDADPRSELLRAFRLLDTGTGGASEAGATSVEGHAPPTLNTQDSDKEGFLSVADLTATMRAAGVPDEHVLMVIRAAGADLGDERIPYTRLADALYPAAATAAKRKRTTITEAAARKEVEKENAARETWEDQRTSILHSGATGALAESGTLPALIPIISSAPAPSASSGLDPRASATGGFVLATDGKVDVPTVPALNFKLNRGASSGVLGGEELTPRRQEIVRSMSDASTVPATPRTIADRVQRARRATEVSKLKSSTELSRRLSGESDTSNPMDPTESDAPMPKKIEKV